MRRFEEAEIIAGLELISRTTPSRQAIEHAIERVRISLQGAMRAEEAGPVLWQIVGRSTVVRFAAAAVLVITVLLAAVYLWHRGIIRPASRAGQVVKEVVEKKQTTEQTAAQSAAEAEAIKAELARVERGYEAKDVAGLTAMLANDNMQVRIAAANYLALIGDINAVGALEKAGSQWEGQGENPFDAAIEAIKVADQNVPQTSGAAAESADAIPHHSGPGILVHIIAKDTRKPIGDVKANAGRHYGSPASWKDWNATVDERGFCWLDCNDGTPSFVSIWVGGAAGYVPMHVMWHEDMNKPSYFEFLLDKGTRIAGRVEDANGKPIADARVAVTIPVEQPRGQAYISIMDYGAQTDAEGRWGLDIIPAEAKEIQLKLSHRDYVDDSEPRKPGQGYTVEQLRAGTAVLKMERSPMILSGRITDANTGGPVTDAQVEIQGGPWRSSKTDTNGFYCFEQEGFRGNWGDFRIGIFTNEYKGITQYSERPVVHLEQDSRVVKDFKLTRACMIEMRVVDEEGRPIEQSRLTAASMASRYGSGGERFAYTDSNGMVLMGGLEPSEIEYLITATHSKRTWMEDGERAYPEETFDYAPGHLTVKLNNPEVISVGEIVLKKGVEVKGYAEYSDGVPASNVKLIAYPEWWRGSDSSDGFLIDANGYFVLSNIEPGNHRIVAKIPRGRGFLQQDVAWQILPLAERELLKVIIPEKSDRSTVSITGRARFVGGSKPDFFEIEAYSPGGVPQFGYAFFSPGFQDGNDANFVIDKLELGTYRLRFFGYGVEEKVLEGVEAPSEGLVVELACVEKPRLRGTVVDAQTKTPLRDLRVRVQKLSTLRGTNYWPNESWFDISGTAGRFDIESAGPGVYQVQIAARGFAPKWSSKINTDQNTPVVVELSKGGSIRGIVVDEQGRAVTGAKVMALSEAGNTSGEAFVSEEGAVETIEGRFELSNIPEGSETLKAIHADYALVIVHDIAVQEGQVADGVRIVLCRGGIVEGRVYDANGRGQQYIVLYFQDIESKDGGADNAAKLATTITDANGFYRVSGLPEQLCFVSKQNQWQELGVVCRAVVPQSGKVSRLDFGGPVRVTGRIILDGRPLTNTKLQISLVDAPYLTTYQNFAMTEGEGGFSFYGVPKGRWAIHYQHTEGRSLIWLQAATINVAGTDLDLGAVQPYGGTVTVTVTVEYEDVNATGNITGLHIQTGIGMRGRGVGEVASPAAPGQPYIVRHVPAGAHSIVLSRTDYVRLYEPIEVGSEDLHVTVRIPVCTASVSGRMAGEARTSFALWRSDNKIFAPVYSYSDEHGNYNVKNLPAGHYLVGAESFDPESVVLEFDLAEREDKTVDIDAGEAERLPNALLCVLTADENNIPTDGAEIWLEKAGRRIWPISNHVGSACFVVSADTYTLNVRLAGYHQVIREVTIVAQSKERALDEPLIVWLEKQ